MINASFILWRMVLLPALLYLKACLRICLESPCKTAKNILSRGAILLGCMVLTLSPSVSFATNAQDISIGLKVLLLVKNFHGMIPIAIVYNPDFPDSLADATSIKNSIDAGLGITEELTFNAYLVSSKEMNKLLDAKVAFLTDNLLPDGANAVCDTAGKQGILTISGNIGCVKANKCVLGIISKPRVEIYYSPVAAEASHLSFDSAFMMLVKPI